MLSVDGNHFSVVQNGSSIENVTVFVNKADDSNEGFWDEFCQFPNRLLISLNKLGFEEQILRRVTRYRQFRESNDVCLNLFCPLNSFSDFSCVAINVTDCSIDLRKRDPQGAHFTNASNKNILAQISSVVVKAHFPAH